MIEIPGYRRKLLLKRCFDIFVALFALPVCFTGFAVLSLMSILEQLVTWDFGPLIISERRVSRGQEFNLCKINMFREKARKQYESEHDYFKTDGSYAYLQKEKNSLRFFGGVMKKYYLDELAQVINVLKGDMSIVGPRPRPVNHNDNRKIARRVLKTGIFGFNANKWKNAGQTIMPYSSDDEYFECFRLLSPLGMLNMDALVVVDGFTAILRGKGL